MSLIASLNDGSFNGALTTEIHYDAYLSVPYTVKMYF